MTFKKLIFMAIPIAILISLSSVTPILTLTLNTNKDIYNVGEEIQIYGMLYYKWEPNIMVADLVTIQVNYPLPHGLCLLRTVPTDSLAGKTWLVEILQVTPCDQNGNPKNNFTKGTLAYFKIEWKNNDNVEHYVILTLSLTYGNNVPFKAYSPTAGTLAANETRLGVFSVPIPSDAPTGPAKVYANALTNWPSSTGYAYCPEKSASFTITSSSSSTFINLQQTEQGTYNLTFRLPSKGAFIGNYTIYANSRLIGTQQATNTTIIRVILLGDINHDLVVDGQDLQLVKKAVPSSPGSPNWNQEADLNNDGVIDGQDYSIIKKYIGNYAYT